MYVCVGVCGCVGVGVCGCVVYVVYSMESPLCDDCTGNEQCTGDCTTIGT